ncbi:hypothetical protein ABEB36_015556 [Hypothenemus hampei]|uniref:Uncharacterized protein n=1 Tax=Hypothenemus hampei TaxID=57062 RepID=A0ABD1E0C8_HYPHA
MQFKICRFRVIPENLKILTVTGSHRKRCCTLTAGNILVELLGPQEDLISYVLTFLNFKKSLSEPPKYASEVASFQTSITCLFQMECPNFCHGMVFTIQKSTTFVNITLSLNPAVSKFPKIGSFLRLKLLKLTLNVSIVANLM